MKKYIPLWCKSNFSFLEGASHPEELAKKCIDLNIPAFALTDRDGVYGIVRAHEVTKKHTLKLIIGSELTVANSINNKKLPTESIILLAQNKTGYANLCKLISRGRLRSPKGKSLLTWNEVCEYSSNLIALWEGRKLLLNESYSTWLEHATQLQEAFCSASDGKTGNRVYSLITRHYLPKDNFIETNLTKLSAKIGMPITGTTEILYHEKDRKPVQDVLTCIRYKTTLNKSGSLLKSNDQHYIKSPFEFYNLFADRPDLVETGLQIAEKCNFSLSELNYNYPSELLPNGYTSLEWLTHIALEGAKRRYRNNIPSQSLLQLNKEIKIIGDLDYCGYFLTMYEIVKFCNSRKILCQGRGSAANSIVCYCLEITAIDPVRMELLFERFLSKERAEPPDIDLDIEHHRREEVINFVYTKYGIDHAAMVANIVRYRTKSAIRDIGKTLEIPNTSLEKITQSFQGQEKKPKILPLTSAKKSTLYLNATYQDLLIELVTKIQKFPRHLSVHPGGFLLGNEPIYNFVPIENAAIKNRTIIQWDKTDIERLSLFKLDLLGLGALTQINSSFDLIRHYYKNNQTMATISFKDKSVFDMITSNDTIGVFQIESRAQMSLLPRLQPRTFYDLVIQVALVRPGPITGKMVHPYLKRRNGEEPIEYPHPKLRPVLIKTLGIPLFQEQVMKIAITAANYTAEEANQLRRDMSMWQNSNNIEKHEKKFVSRMIKAGSSKKSAKLIFNQIRGFGEYGFPESHAASFALIAYTSAWIKYHYHDIFTVTLLNSWPMGFYNRATLLADACRHGIKILPIDINISEWQCTLEKPTQTNSDKENIFRKTSIAPIQDTLNFRPRYAIRIGLKFLNGLSKTHAEKIVNDRKKQPFQSIQNMALRLTNISSNILIKLAESGALNSISENTNKQPLVEETDYRRENLWLVLEAINNKPRPTKKFSQNINDIEFPKSTPEKILNPLDRLSKIHWDYLSLAYSTHGHPTELLHQQIKSYYLPDAKKILVMHDGQKTSYVGMVICRQKPKTAGGVVFITLEDKSGLVNIIVWPKIFKKFYHIILNSLFLGVNGTIQRKGTSMVYIIAQNFWKLNLKDLY